jgi:3-hydroxy-9,10-secoandrosta-1,3,5(10)-triene-9,17-dione monooxygenase
MVATAHKAQPLHASPIGAEEFLARVRSILPAIRERSQACDALRHLPDETLREFTELGLMKVSQPARYGGYELNWDVLCAAGQTMSQACGSQAWIFKNLADHAQMVGTFSAEAQDDVWKDDSNVLIASSFDPVGKAKRVPGGFEFSGRHGFSSGIDHASWLIAGGTIIDEPERGPFFFLIPKSDAVVIDDWHVMGLAGTGSKSFEVERAFVPEHRILSHKLATQGKGPGTEVNKAPVFRIPRGSGITTAGFASQCVGLAQGVCNEWVDYTIPRKSRGVAIAAQQVTQALLADAAAEIDAADLLCRTSLRNGLDLVAAGKLPSAVEIATGKRNMAYAAQRSVSAATKLFNAAGGRVLTLDNHLQRQYRNLLAAASHHGLAWDKAAVEYGSVVLQQSKQS